tara:strand:- start:257 stop:457 length:201 start_codon:yes stop_codon:yes gene_type:complete
MKVRAILVVDMDVEGGFKEVAAEQVKLEEWLVQLEKSTPTIVGSTLDVKERRGDTLPDLSKKKLKA